MFVNRINPVLLEFGPLEVRIYGLVYALGFLITYFFLRKLCKKGKMPLNEKQLDDLILYLLIGIVAGARLLETVFYRPNLIWTDPLEILKVWHGGLSFHGGLIGGIVSLYLFAKKQKVNLMMLLDAIVVPAILALALGRIANFTNHELYGPITTVAWCVVFPVIDQYCRHPYQIYASISHFILFFILLKVYVNQKKEGTTFWTFVLGYGAMRFATDFWREDPRWLGISTGQYLCLIMVVIGVICLVRLAKAGGNNKSDL